MFDNLDTTYLIALIARIKTLEERLSSLRGYL